MNFSLVEEKKRPTSKKKSANPATVNSSVKVTGDNLQQEDEIVKVVYEGLVGLGIDEALEIFNADFIGQHKVYEEKVRTLVKRGLLKIGRA